MICRFVLVFCWFLIITRTAKSCYTSIFVLGDSLSDNGNLLLVSRPTNLHQGHLPNGETYFHRATGRCCDGRLIVDFLAEYFGLPSPPPVAALKINANNTHMFHPGVNFAVAGARALDSSYYGKIGVFDSVTNDSLGDQMEGFKSLLQSFCVSRPADCRRQLMSSIVLLGPFGGNDYRYALLQGVNAEERKALTFKITSALSMAVMELIELGVRTVMVPGLVPDGCLAVSLTYFGSPNDDSGCITWLNDLDKFHNDLLQKRLNVVRKRYPDANIIYADYFSAAFELFTSPEKYGFQRSFAACCGAGGPYNFNQTMQCGDPFATACPDPSVYINWDGPHFTEAANAWITNLLLKRPYTYPPIHSSCISDSPNSKHSFFSHQAL